MSLKTQYNFPVRKKSSISNSENSPKSRVKRALFGKADLPASPKKARICDENKDFDKPKIALASSSVNAKSLIEAKQVFHTCLPTRLVGRSKEMSDIHCFLSDHINNKKPGSLYLSGAPGTGKTSSLMFVKKGLEAKFNFAFINCMTVNTPATIYKAIAKEYGLSAKLANSKQIVTALKNHILKSKTMNVLVLDEIDQLDTKDQHVLYSLFEWPHLPNSSLVLIGIANALDLTDRVLPLLNTFTFQPKLMHFLPYTKEQIVSILEDRLSEVKIGSNAPVIKPVAIQLCARKIAANTGDIRKALDVCRRAVEVVENRLKNQSTLKSTADDRCNPGSPRKRTDVQAVDLQEISSVLHEAYGSRLQTSSLSSNTGTVTMPLQHMILLCTLVLIKKNCKIQDLTLGKAYDTYRRICNKKDIAVVDESTFHGLCRLVETRGFIAIKDNKVPRLSKVILNVEDNEVEHVLQDKVMLPSILADKSVLYR